MTSGHIRTQSQKYFKSGNVKPKLILLQFVRYHAQINILDMLIMLKKYKWHCSFVLVWLLQNLVFCQDPEISVLLTGILCVFTLSV